MPYTAIITESNKGLLALKYLVLIQEIIFSVLCVLKAKRLVKYCSLDNTH